MTHADAVSVPGPDHTLVRYFALLDARDIDGLVAMFAPTGIMITTAGTGGRPLCGRSDLRDFFVGVGPAVAHHVVTEAAESPTVSLAEGLSRPLQSGPTRFFLASALLDNSSLIRRFTTLVWDQLTAEQERAIVHAATT
jgi:hypothetical protein